MWLWVLFRRLCWRRGDCGVGWGAAVAVGEDVPDRTGDAGCGGLSDERRS